MIQFDASQIQWREPWLAVSLDYAPKAEAELRREMCAGHVLFAREFVAVGCRQDCDDVLFYLGDTTPRFAVVHLTWQRETLPEWPSTVLFSTIEVWIEQCLIPDVEEFSL
jgi:hypothetical protein